MAFDYFWIGAGFFLLVAIAVVVVAIILAGLLFGGGKKGLDPKNIKRFGKMFPPMLKAKGIYGMNQSGQFIPIAVVVLTLFLIVAFTVGGVITAVYAAFYFFGGSVAMIAVRTILGRANAAMKQNQGKSIGRFKMP